MAETSENQYSNIEVAPVSNGNVATIVAGTALNIVSGSSAASQDPMGAVRNSIGWSKVAVYLKNTFVLAGNGDWGQAKDQAIMAAADAVRNSHTAMGIAAAAISKLPAGGIVIEKGSALLSLPQSAPIIGMGFAGAAAGMNKGDKKSGGKGIITRFCQGLGGVIGAAGGSMVEPGLGTVAGAFVASEASAEFCARKLDSEVPTGKKTVGSVTVAIAEGLELPKLVAAAGATLKENTNLSPNPNPSVQSPPKNFPSHTSGIEDALSWQH